MTGPEHYAEAERLTELASRQPSNQEGNDNAKVLLAAAQAHATLALVAATINPAMGWPSGRPWRTAIQGGTDG